jgi:hypothetical protein
VVSDLREELMPRETGGAGRNSPALAVEHDLHCVSFVKRSAESRGQVCRWRAWRHPVACRNFA